MRFKLKKFIRLRLCRLFKRHYWIFAGCRMEGDKQGKWLIISFRCYDCGLGNEYPIKMKDLSLDNLGWLNYCLRKHFLGGIKKHINKHISLLRKGFGAD